MRPTPSTWPETKCPPSSLSSVRHRSRLTRLPGLSSPRMVHRRVSAETSIANRPALLEMTVRHAPLTVIESPTLISEVGNEVWIVITAPWSVGLRLSTVPRSSTIPVNIVSPAANPVGGDKEPEKSYHFCRTAAQSREEEEGKNTGSISPKPILGFGLPVAPEKIRMRPFGPVRTFLMRKNPMLGRCWHLHCGESSR